MITFLLNLSTRLKLLLGFGLIVCLMAVNNGLAWRDTGDLSSAQQRLFEEELGRGYLLMEMRAAFNRERTTLASLALSDGPQRPALFERHHVQSAEVEKLLKSLEEKTRDDKEFGGDLDVVMQARKGFVALRDREVLPLLEANKRAEAANVILGPLTDRFETFRVAADRINERKVQRSKEVMTEFNDVVEASRARLVIGNLAALLVGLLLVLLLDRSIARPLKNLAGLARRIADGDLSTQTATSARRDEVGQVLKSVDQMAITMKQVVNETNRGIATLAAAAEDISGTTAKVSAGAAQSAAAISETTTTVEEVKQTALLSSQKARTVSETAQGAAQTAMAGQRAIDDGMRGMNDIQQQVESIAGTIVRLSERSQAIAEIIASVGALAEQSNLLAVNAAIEAAKAGEHGKGFGVVAQEVKNLAEQSRQATRQVRQILSEIEKAISATVMSTELASRTVSSGVEQVRDAGNAIHDLAQGISEAAHSAVQISASSQQQLAGMDQVAIAMENIKQVSSENVAGARQSENLARELDALSRDLSKISARFRTE
jgi:methyl-accepting chemotaxis protein